MSDRIFIFHATDYWQYPLGGTLGTIKTYLRYTKFECILIGITNDPNTIIGKWTEIEIDGRYYDFLPVALSTREIVPHKVLLLFGILTHGHKIVEKCGVRCLNAMIFVNRECYVLLKYILGRQCKVNTFYKMTDAVNPLETSGRRIAKLRMLQSLYFILFLRPLLFGSSVIFSISAECRQFCQRTLVSQKDREKIVDVNHYVDYDRLLNIYNTRVIDQNGTKKILIFWGRIVVVKGLDLLIESTRELVAKGQETELWLIGDGEERLKLEFLAKKLGLASRVTFWGAKSIQDIAGMSKVADLFVMSSYSEGLPTAMLEALVFGLPVVSTPVGGIPTLVREGVNGCLVHERSAIACVDAIERALKLDRLKATEYGRQLVEREFSARNVIDKMNRVIKAHIDNLPGCST